MSKKQHKHTNIPHIQICWLTLKKGWKVKGESDSQHIPWLGLSASWVLGCAPEKCEGNWLHALWLGSFTYLLGILTTVPRQLTSATSRIPSHGHFLIGKPATGYTNKNGQTRTSPIAAFRYIKHYEWSAHYHELSFGSPSLVNGGYSPKSLVKYPIITLVTNQIDRYLAQHSPVQPTNISEAPTSKVDHLCQLCQPFWKLLFVAPILIIK